MSTRTGSRQLNFVSTWNVVAAGVGVPSGADGDMAGVTAELPAGYVPQPASATALRMTAAAVRVRMLVKRSGRRSVMDARLVAKAVLLLVSLAIPKRALPSCQ